MTLQKQQIGWRSYSAAYRQRHREAGICIRCQRPAQGGTVRCAEHRALHNREAREANARRRAASS